MFATMLAIAPFNYGAITSIWYFPAIGMLAAIIANTSGTGGGVVFVPVFNILRESGVYPLSPLQVTAASFLIQCFGMSVRALSWTPRMKTQQDAGSDSQSVSVNARDYWTVICVVLIISLPAMLITQHVHQFESNDILIGFKSFSLLLGSLLILSAWTVNRNVPEQTALQRLDIIVLMLFAGFGGFLMALFSVGVGEFVALYLFIRHYPILLSTGTACVISAISALFGAIWHIDNDTVPWEVVALAVPGAILGALLARPLALWLGSLRLKTMDGLWILASSLYLILLNI